MPTSKPLTGIHVVEIGHSVAAPYAAMILGELGTDVIKVESPTKGDYARSWGPPFHDGAAPHYLTLNRGKHGISVDLADPAQRQRLRELILNEADAVGIVPYQAFLATDGWIVIAAGNDGLFVKLARALGMPELAEEARFRRNSDRVLNRAALLAVLNEAVARRSVAELRASLDSEGVPNAPVQRIDQVIHDPLAEALGILQEGPAGSLKTIGLPLRFDRTRPSYDKAAPRLGEHNAEILDAAEVPRCGACAG